MGGEEGRQLREGPWVPTVFSCPSAPRPPGESGGDHSQGPGVGVGGDSRCPGPSAPCSVPRPQARGSVLQGLHRGPPSGLQLCCAPGPGGCLSQGSCPRGPARLPRGDDARCAWQAQHPAGRNGPQSREGGARAGGLRAQRPEGGGGGLGPQAAGCWVELEAPLVPPGWRACRPGCFGKQRLRPGGAARHQGPGALTLTSAWDCVCSSPGLTPRAHLRWVPWGRRSLQVRPDWPHCPPTAPVAGLGGHSGGKTSEGDQGEKDPRRVRGCGSRRGRAMVPAPAAWRCPPRAQGAAPEARPCAEAGQAAPPWQGLPLFEPQFPACAAQPSGPRPPELAAAGLMHGEP